MIQQFGQQDVVIEKEQLNFDGFFKLKKAQLRHRLFKGGWSNVFEREICVRGDAVGILLYDPRCQKFALVEQLRMGVIGRKQSPWLLEIVAGMLDKDAESEEQVARREALEEAGLEVEQVEYILSYYPSAGGSTERMSLFCGKVNLQDVAGGVFGLIEENEDIRLHIMPVNEALAWLHQGKLENAMTIITLQWFQLNQARLDAQWND